MLSIRKVRSFTKLGHERWQVLEALAILIAVQICLRTIPFRWWSPRLGRIHIESDSRISDDQNQVALSISKAITIAVRNLPWQAMCLAQAIAARQMLARRGISGTLYLGLQKEERGRFQAHAWVRCGERIVTGASSQSYSVISKFAFGMKEQATTIAIESKP